jgi:hypothetical protein
MTAYLLEAIRLTNWGLKRTGEEVSIPFRSAHSRKGPRDPGLAIARPTRKCGR